jgi:tetratricopeptide (TPR) repeat protein
MNDEAESHFAKGQTVEAALRLGDQLLEQGDIDGAQAAFEQVEAAGDVRGSLKLAILMERHRENREAAEAAWRRADEAGDVDGSGNLGRLLRDQGDVHDAEAAFRRCVDRGSRRAIADWAALLIRREGATVEEVAEAIDLLCREQDRFIMNKDTSVISHTFELDEMEERCAPAAIEAGTRRADEQGSASGAWHLAWALRKKGNLPDAVAAFRRAAERGRDDAWLYGASTCLEMGDTAAVEAMARRGDSAGSAIASTMLGSILDEKGRGDEALEAYKRADAGGDGNGSFNMGVTLLECGNLHTAEGALQRAVERGTDNAEEAAEALAHVRGLITG